MVELTDEQQATVNWCLSHMMDTIIACGSDGIPYWDMFPLFERHLGFDRTLYEWCLAILLREGKIAITDNILFYLPPRKEVLH